MRFVMRDPDGSIASVHRDPVVGSVALPDDHPDVLAFMGHDTDAAQAAHNPGQAFAGLDADLVRVIEDLIDALIERNVLRITDLPGEAQQKLFDRKHFRSRMQAHSLQLFGAQFGGPMAGMGSEGVLSAGLAEPGAAPLRGSPGADQG